MLSFFLVRHLDLPMQLQLLQHPQVLQKSFAYEIAITMIQRNLERAELYFDYGWQVNLDSQPMVFFAPPPYIKVDVLDLRDTLLGVQQKLEGLDLWNSLDTDEEERDFIARIQNLIAKTQILRQNRDFYSNSFLFFMKSKMHLKWLFWDVSKFVANQKIYSPPTY